MVFSLFSLLSAPYLLGERKRERGTHSQWLKPTERKRRWIKAKAEARRNLVAVLRSRGRQRHHTGKREEKKTCIYYIDPSRLSPSALTGRFLKNI